MTVTGFPDISATQMMAGRSRRYRTPDGEFPSVTTILKVLGLATEGLIKWSANEERKAVLEACAEVFAEGVDGGPAEFADAVEQRIGKARAHQKQLTKGAEVGSAIHQEIQRQTMMMLGGPVTMPGPMPDAAQLAVMAWSDWLKDSGLRPFRAEQTVWDAELGYAGTIDLLAYDPNDDLILADYKSSKGIYDDFHLQVGAYLKAARNFAPVKRAIIVRFPKDLSDPIFKTAGPPIEVKELGQMYDRTLTEEQLYHAFTGAKMAWDMLIRKDAA